MKNPIVRLAKVVSLAMSIAAAAHADPVLNSAIAPNARSGAANAPLTVFASLTNSGTTGASSCIVQARQTGVSVDYRTLNPDNTIDGSAPNVPFSVPAGQTQALLLTFQTSLSGVADMPVDFTCTTSKTTSFLGLNTVSIWALGANTPDIIPIVVTPSGDSVIRINTVGGVGFMAAAAVNIGGSGSVIVRPSFWRNDLFVNLNGSQLLPLAPVTLSICETGSDGACLAPPTLGGLTINFGSGETRTFTVFADVEDSAGLPFMPDINRVFLSFTRTSGTPANTAAGISSAAITAPGPGNLTSPAGIYNYRLRETASGREGGMVIMISPSGKMVAWGGGTGGGANANVRQLFDTIYPLILLMGDLTFTPNGGTFDFTSSNTISAPSFGNTGTPSPFVFSGNIAPGLQITGSNSSPLDTFRGVLASQLYDRPRTLADIAGSYSSGALIVAANGTLRRVSGSCVGTGAFTQPTSGKNLFEVTITYDTCSNSTLSGKTFAGLATNPAVMDGFWGDATVDQNPLVMVLEVDNRISGIGMWKHD